MNNQSNQTDAMEQDDSWREEIAELRRKIEIIKHPSKIPRKHGVSNLFHERSKGNSSSESIGIQSLSTSSSSIQTNDSKEISTETSKIFVNTATDPMSKKRKESFIQPEFDTTSIPQPGLVNTASSPIIGSLSSIQSQSPTPSVMSSISKDSAVSSLQPESEENFVADIVQLDESINEVVGKSPRVYLGICGNLSMHM